MTQKFPGYWLLALVMSLVLVGCVPTPEALPDDSVAKIPAGWNEYYSQVITWEECGDGFECAQVDAPLDWTNPESTPIELSVIKHAASAENSLGSLFVNPGGPGASGVDFIKNSLDYAVTSDVKNNYDVIGFDPRGVGQSTPITCLSDAQLDEFLFEPLSAQRGSDQWFAQRQVGIDEFVNSCSENSGQLLPFVDTHSAAKDLDLLRAVVDDRFLNYLGYSYGTLLGAIYADLFPENVGRMVLDGALDPSSTSLDISIQQSIGFENALKAYLADCLESADCPFKGSVNQAMEEISKLLASLDLAPITGSDGRQLGADSMVTAIVTPLYNQDSWGELNSVFEGIFAGDSDPAWVQVDWYYNRVDGTYHDNSTESFLAINCVDYPSVSDREKWAQDAQTISEAAPVIGPYLAWGDQLCVSWPAQPQHYPTQVTAAGSAPILVVGTTGDPATPYVWAKQLANQLENGHLLTLDGEGHAAYTQSNSCVDGTIDTYLLQGTVPKSGTRC